MPILHFHPCPQPTPELVKHVATRVQRQGSQWAWNLIAKSGGRDTWPPAVIALVEAQQREEVRSETAHLQLS